MGRRTERYIVHDCGKDTRLFIQFIMEEKRPPTRRRPAAAVVVLPAATCTCNYKQEQRDLKKSDELNRDF